MGQLEDAERTAIRQLQATIESARDDIYRMVARDGNVAVTMREASDRIAAMASDLDGLVSAEHAEAVDRGIIIIDQPLAMIDERTSSAYVPTDVIEDKRAFLLGRVAARSTEMNDRVVALLMRRATTDELGDTLHGIGERVEGSSVFGLAANALAGATRAGLGDTTGAAMMDRASLAADEGRPRTLKRWVHQGAADPRTEHVVAASRYASGIAWGENFQIGSHSTPYPRGPGLPGGHRYGCRCQLAPVLAPEE